MRRSVKIPFILSAVLIVAAVAMGSANGPHNNYTGSPPNYANCTQCHNSYPVNSGAGDIILSGVPANYTPGSTYPLTLTVADPQALRWGFQITALDPSQQTAGNLTVADPINTQLNPFLPIDVIMHTLTGTYAGTPTSGSWTFNWTAPNTNDEVTFYFAGNAANNNNATSGDYIYTDTLMVSAGVVYPSFIVNVTYQSGSPVPQGGGNIYYDIYVQNTSGAPQNFDGWVDIVYEGGAPNTVLTRSFTNYQPGWTINRSNVFFPVPGGWPGGNYELYARVGQHPNVIWAQDSFAWMKSGVADFSFDPSNMMPTSGFPNPFDEIVQTDAVVSTPEEFLMLKNFPNPFNPATVLSFELPDASFVTLEVFDLSGRRVGVGLAPTHYPAGTHHLLFDGSGLASGIYLARLQTRSSDSGNPTYEAVQKLVLMK